MRKFTIIILLSGIFLSGATNIEAQNADLDLLRKINHSAPGLKPVSVFLSESVQPVSIAVPVILGGYSLFSSDKDLWKDAVFIAGASAINYAFTKGLKYSFNRTRPYDAFPGDIINYDIETDASFPSGHTSGAFATATALSLKYPEWYVIVPSYLWASSVGYSRMHLGMHYPSDVLAGAVLGAGSAWVTWKLNNWLWRNYDIKKGRIIKK
jgi:membrane-associated phospholipid phosphatase